MSDSDIADTIQDRMSLQDANDADDALQLADERRQRERERKIARRGQFFNRRKRSAIESVNRNRTQQRQRLRLTDGIDDDGGVRLSMMTTSAGEDDDDDGDDIIRLARDAGEAKEENEAQSLDMVPEWRPISIKHKLFDDSKEEEKSTEPDYCFMCDCSPNRLDQENATRYTHLRTFIHDNWGIVDHVWLINKAQELYNVGLRPYTDKKLPWYRRVIDQHYTDHHPTIRYMLEDQLQTFTGVLRNIEESGILEESTRIPGRKRVNLQYAQLYNTYCKEMRPLMKLLATMRPQNVA